ncbi:hypothetical protein C5Y96_06895 [Blastopirellula marina]|uniref:DUF695 domain-containing protein n=1 Tax=Blastopirellula marina TaxID=124 RepID=A0A2S8FYG2_9BACT|nr:MULTISPECIES: DUF695 domain-containing protein [Pirellulaceae]PQO36884.1 hypothetical protein C5Y96_06895 [Blastopirellula marina]RCS53599.1 DUF695 domain-containing protein [Bremerella cremea]
MSDDWNAYITRIEDSITSILLDMGIVDDAPDPQRTWLVRVSIALQNPDEYGMTTNEEFDAINPLEEAIVEAIEQGLDAVHVGCMTHDGQRAVVFYSPTFEGVDVALGPVMQAYSTYELRSSCQEDAEWGFYFEIMFPSPYEMQSMSNSSVLQGLLEAGDSLEQERVVSHWAYFPSEQARAQFIVSVQEKGYEVDQESLDTNAEPPNPFGVQIDRVDHVDQASIDQITIELFELAQSLEGTYDGWETFVVRSDEE